MRTNLYKRGCIGFCIGLYLISGLSCRSSRATYFDFPKPIDTETRAIKLQEKKFYSLDGVYADNRFAGARLCDFTQIDSVTFQVDISPENEPINPSPWYAFKLWSDRNRNINLLLNYDSAEHRYQPLFSQNGRDWTPYDSTLGHKSDHQYLMQDVKLSRDTLWVSAQEIVNSESVRSWCLEKALHRSVAFRVVGSSLMGRDMFCLEIREGEKKKKPTIVILSRQHPPEVTGYFAMQAFIDEILKDNVLANDFRKKYQLLVYPLMNPDGVDLGHWRHNAGGIDLNRDWAYYHQPEVRQVANDVVKETRTHKSKVILGLDFHSTWYDVFYTNNPVPKQIPGFKDYWIFSVKEAIRDSIRESASDPLSPVSKNWFYTQFGAVGITYEIGDFTPREFIEEKGHTTALEMMKLLIYQD